MLVVSQVSTLGIMKQKCFCQCSRIHLTKYLCDDRGYKIMCIRSRPTATSVYCVAVRPSVLVTVKP